ncbi:MAG: biopolymer transporter ExbD [Prevotellaceae bacterium]|jgi:biopolymer transport protein ExbD|nr:biopolymer transporter ExbD [Prevotellaceae bacterium]
MRISRKREGQPEVYTASLSDIMFFLLLFFLIISTMVNPSVIQLMLPKASANVQKMAKQTLNISITADKQYYLNDKPIAFEEIKPAIEGMVTPTEAATVILRADKSIQLQDLVDVLDIGHQLRVKMILATSKE